MRFLLDANLPRSAARVVMSLGHEVVDVRDIELGGSEDKEIAAYAQANGLALITRDFDFSDIRNYPPSQYTGISCSAFLTMRSPLRWSRPSSLSCPSRSCSLNSQADWLFWNHGEYGSVRRFPDNS